MKVFFKWICCLFVFLSAGNIGFAETSNRVVAIVNDEVITLYELNNKIEEMTGQTGEDIRAQDEKKYLATRREVLDLLINERIAQEKIQELGINVTQDQIDAAIEDIKKTNNITQEALIDGLKEQGITFERYRETIKNQLERIRLINYEVKSKILIREEQLKQYYIANQDRFSQDSEVHIAGIFLKMENPDDKKESDEIHKKGQEILERLKQGEDFGAIAKTYSQGPGAQEGGNLGTFKTSQIDPVLQKVLKDLPEGGISDLITRGNVLQIIKLIKREDAKVRPFDEVRQIIYETLYKQEVDQRYAAWIKNLRENTFTKIIF